MTTQRDWAQHHNAEVIHLGEPELRNLRTRVFVTAKSMGQKSHLFPARARAVHVPHSPVSLHRIYPAGSFNGFTDLFAVGPHHLREFRCVASRTDGQSFRVGYGRLPFLQEQERVDLGRPVAVERHKTVLLAPSWHNGNFFEEFGADLVRLLLKNEYRVVFRPHFKGLKTESGLRAVMKKFLPPAILMSRNFEIQGFHTNKYVFSGVSSLVTDFSGIGFEFAAVRGLPTIFVDSGRKIRNYDHRCQDVPAFEVEARADFGLISRPSAVEVLSHLDQSRKVTPVEWEKKIKLAQSNRFFNFESGIADSGAEALREVVDQT